MWRKTLRRRTGSIWSLQCRLTTGMVDLLPQGVYRPVARLDILIPVGTDLRSVQTRTPGDLGPGLTSQRWKVRTDQKSVPTGRTTSRREMHALPRDRRGRVHRLPPVRAAARPRARGHRARHVHPVLPPATQGAEPRRGEEAREVPVPPTRPAYRRPEGRRRGGRSRLPPRRHAGPGGELDRLRPVPRL